MGRRRAWAAMHSQQGLRPTPQGALKLACPLCVVSYWGKGIGLLSFTPILSLYVVYSRKGVTLGETTIF